MAPVDTELYHAVRINHIGDAGYVIGIGLFLGLTVIGACALIGLTRLARAQEAR